MLKIILTGLFFTLFFSACNSEKNIDLSDPMESGRGFIEASLKGDYATAKRYVMQDSANMRLFQRMELFYKDMNEKDKEGYKNANIIINPTDNISDSVAIINYSNTYKNKPSKIKVVRMNNNWMIDFKYPFSGNM